MVTATELIENCLLSLRDPHQDWHKPSKMLSYVNRSLRDIANKSQSITSYGFLPVIKDIFRYPLPHNFLQALIVGFDAGSYGWRELSARMDSTIDRVSLSVYNNTFDGYPLYYSVAGRSVVDRFYGYVKGLFETDLGISLKDVAGDVFNDAPFSLFQAIVKNGDRLLNVTDGSEARISGTELAFGSDIENFFYHEVPFGGIDNIFEVNDEIRIVSPEQSRHTVNLAPHPTLSSKVGEEPLSLFYARRHRVVTQTDIDNENDMLELDIEFESALENRVCYYGSLARHDVDDQQTRLFKADYVSDYNEAFPNINKRVREAASLWKRDASSYVGGSTTTSVIPSSEVDFDFTMERDFNVVRGHDAVTGIIGWKQGSPKIENFGVDDISLLFYADKARADEISSGDSRFSIGDETLAEIVTLEDFVDNSDGTGSVTVRIDPRDITASELMADRKVYVALRVSQP